MQYILLFFGQHRTIPALRLKHRSGSLFPPLAALTFAASSIICAFGLAAAAPRSPYRHLELCGIAFIFVCLWVQCAVDQHAQVLYGR